MRNSEHFRSERIRELKINRFLQIILAIILPFVILMGSVRLLITPGFAVFEYQRSWFPEDPFGMAKDERLKWSRYAINYLTNNEELSYLGDLRFEDGEKVFNERELEHLLDVKKVVKTCLMVWYVVIAITFLLMTEFLATKASADLKRSLLWGSWLTIGIIGSILFLLALSFNRLFERFHQLFFAEGTWLFYQNDTLIRLFPLEFWRDAFILVCGISLFFAGLIFIIIALIKRCLARGTTRS